MRSAIAKASGGRVDRDEALELYLHAPTRSLDDSPTGPRAEASGAASSPTSSTATSTTRTSASRAATSARSTVRSDPTKATCSASRRSSARSTRPSRSAAASSCCRAAQSRSAARVVRGPVPRGEGALSRRSGCTRCRRRRSSISRACRGCRCRGDRTSHRRRPRQHPGGGAEILVDRVRKLLNCYGKATADEWLDVMRHAHRAGLRTTATMMYGHVETAKNGSSTCSAARLQDEARWIHRVHRLELPAGAHRTRRLRGDRRRLPAHARHRRLVLDNFDNLQASWVTQGGRSGS